MSASCVCTTHTYRSGGRTLRIGGVFDRRGDRARPGAWVAGRVGEGTAVLELRVHLFGPFQIVSADREVAGSILRKAQELLALVLLAPQRNVRRELAAEVIWPDAGPEA